MTSDALADRLVEVIAITAGQTPEYRYGSGCIITGRTVLTAAHVIEGADQVLVRNRHKEYLTVEWPGAAGFIGTTAGRGPDLALLELGADTPQRPPLPLARVNRETSDGQVLQRCVAAGYPEFTEHPFEGGVVRDLEQASGQILPLSSLVEGLLTLHVSSAPVGRVTDGPARSPWSGMSGAPVLRDGHLLGVVTMHAQRSGPSAITVTPLTALVAIPGNQRWGAGVPDPGAWFTRMGVSGLDDFTVLPDVAQRAADAQYQPVEAIRQHTGILEGRERELQALAEFAVSDRGYHWQAGSPWAGKTALLAEFIGARLPDEVDVVYYFLSRAGATGTSAGFLQTVVRQLATHLDERLPTASEHQFSSLWQRAASRAAQQGRHLLLVVDGMDEDLDAGSLSVASLLPTEVAGLAESAWNRAHVIISSRSGWVPPGDVAREHPLRTVEPHHLAPVPVSASLERAAEQKLDQLKSITHAHTVLAVLAAAAGPVSLSDIQELSRLSRGDIAGVLRRASPILTVTGQGQERRYFFAHSSLLERARNDDELDCAGFREKIDAWARHWQAARWHGDGDGVDRTPMFLLDTYLGTLAHDSPMVLALVQDVGWATAALQRTSVDSVMAQLQTLVTAARGVSGSASLLAVIRAQAPDLRLLSTIDEARLLRQLCLQAEELGEPFLAGDFRHRLNGLIERTASAQLVPQWSSRRGDRALVSELQGDVGWVNAVAAMRDGRVVAGGKDGWVRLWDPNAPDAGWIGVGRHEGPVRALTVKGEQIYSAGHDHRVLSWNSSMPGVRPTLIGHHDGEVRALAAHDQGVLSGGDDTKVMLWPDGGGPGVEIGQHAGSVRAIAVRGDGTVISAGDDARLKLWAVEHPQVLIGQTRPIAGRRILCVAVTAEGAVIAGANDSMVYRWLRPFPQGDEHPADVSDSRAVQIGSHQGAVRAVAVIGTKQVISGGDDGRLRVWAVGRHGARQRIELGSHDGAVRALAVRGEHLISGGFDQRIRTWDLHGTREDLVAGTGPKGAIRAVTILDDGCQASAGQDRSIWVRDVVRGGNALAVGSVASAVTALLALPGRRIASASSQGHIQVWDVNQPGTAVHSAKGPPGAVLTQLADASGRERFAWGGYDGWIQVWEPGEPDAVRTVARHVRPVSAMAGLPDGRLLSGDIHGVVTVSHPDVEVPRSGTTAPVRNDFPGFAGRLNVLATVPGVVIGGGDSGVLCVWDLATGTIVEQVKAHRSWITSLVVLPGGNLVSGGTDERLRSWSWNGQALSQTSVTACSVQSLSSGRLGGRGCLAVAHVGTGSSYWTSA